MVNSPQLAAHVAASMGKPLTSTLQHLKNLREAKGATTEAPLVTAGGRGRNAPAMSRKDAATLICALLGSEAIQDSVKTIEAMQKLTPHFHGYRFKGRFRSRGANFDVDAGIRPEHNVVEALEQILHFFEREPEYRMHLDREGLRDPNVYVLFEVEFPSHFASLSLRVPRMFSMTWTYGRRSGDRDEQLRRCRQDALREISQVFRPITQRDDEGGAKGGTEPSPGL